MPPKAPSKRCGAWRTGRRTGGRSAHSPTSSTGSTRGEEPSPARGLTGRAATGVRTRAMEGAGEGPGAVAGDTGSGLRARSKRSRAPRPPLRQAARRRQRRRGAHSREPRDIPGSVNECNEGEEARSEGHPPSHIIQCEQGPPNSPQTSRVRSPHSPGDTSVAAARRRARNTNPSPLHWVQRRFPSRRNSSTPVLRERCSRRISEGLRRSSAQWVYLRPSPSSPRKAGPTLAMSTPASPSRQRNDHSKPRKDVWLRPLRRDWKRILRR